MSQSYEERLIGEFDEEIYDTYGLLFERYGNKDTIRKTVKILNPFSEEIDEELIDHPVVSIHHNFLDRIAVRNNYDKVVEFIGKDFMTKTGTLSGGSSVLFFASIIKLWIAAMHPEKADVAKWLTGYQKIISSWICDTIYMNISRNPRNIYYVIDVWETIEKNVLYPLRFFSSFQLAENLEILGIADGGNIEDEEDNDVECT